MKSRRRWKFLPPFSLSESQVEIKIRRRQNLLTSYRSHSSVNRRQICHYPTPPNLKNFRLNRRNLLLPLFLSSHISFLNLMMRPHFASFFLFLSVSLADDCSPKPCGYLTYVGFPFWLENVHHPSCGFPSFKVTCINGKPQIRISSLNYSVKSLNFSDETLILSPVETQIFACGVLGYEFFLNSTPFSLLPSTNNLVFHYNCSNTSVPKGYKRLECGQRNNSLVGWSEDNNGLVACERVSRLPSVAPRSVDLGGLETVLGFGFFVKWRAVDCSQCRRSGGGCRYNLKQNRFGCLCGDRLLFSNCAGPGSLTFSCFLN